MENFDEHIGTSDSHPIYAGIIPQEETPLFKGRLGITFAPGKCHYGISSRIKWERDVEKDLMRLKTEYNTNTIVTLIEQFEFSNLKISDLRPKIFEKGMKSIWFPIKDGHIPECGEETMAKFDLLISYLFDLLVIGENLIVHCMGGLGRAGTVATCLLIKAGKSYEEALQVVRKTRKGAVENSLQEEFIKNYSKFTSSLGYNILNNNLIVKF